MTDALIGQEVEGYRIQEVLGRGGMGIVYRAEDTFLSRPVALKRINPDRAGDEAFLRRFRSEAHALARIDSPHITRIYALRETDYGLLIVMEFVEGGTLSDALQAGPMEVPAALPLIKQVLRALEDAHRVDLIHRDIKPSNILLTPDRTVKVTDFGLVKVRQGDGRSTLTRGVVGTLNYMSPEHVKGTTRLDHRTDLYSLGMTAYEMLAGRLPFDEDSSEFVKMRTIVEEAFPSPDQFRANVPDGLAQIIMKALAKDPDRRYQNAVVMREAIEAFQAGQAAAETPPTITVIETASRRTAYGPTASSSTVSGAAASGSTASGDVASTRTSNRRRRLWTALSAAVVLMLVISGYWLWSGDLFAWRNDDGSTERIVSAQPERDALPLVGGTVESTFAATRQQLQGAADTTRKIESEPASSRGRPETHRLPSVAALPPTSQIASAENEGTPPEQADSDDPLADPSATEAPTTSQPAAGEGTPSAAKQLPEPNDIAPATATLTVRVEPTGAIEIGGQRRSGGGTFQVPPGRQTIRFSHPEYGIEQETIQLEPGESRELTYYFEHPLRVETDGPSGEIVLDGRAEGKHTPAVLHLGPGRHMVYLRFDDYAVSGGRQYVVIDGNRRQIATFIGNVKIVIVRPSFEQVQRLLVYQTRKETP